MGLMDTTDPRTHSNVFTLLSVSNTEREALGVGWRSAERLRSSFRLLKVDLLVFDVSPQPLDEDVIHPATATVHADLHAQFRQRPGPFSRGELTAPWSELKTSGTLRHLQGLLAQVCAHCVGNGPSQHVARVQFITAHK